jgi:hypothetical protein
MNMQGGQTSHGSLFGNVWVQSALLVIVAVIVVALAAKYLW